MGMAVPSSPSVRNELQAYSKLLLLMNIVSFDSTEQQLCEQPFLGRKEINYGEKSLCRQKSTMFLCPTTELVLFFSQALSNAKN